MLYLALVYAAGMLLIWQISICCNRPTERNDFSCLFERTLILSSKDLLKFAEAP